MIDANSSATEIVIREPSGERANDSVIPSREKPPTVRRVEIVSRPGMHVREEVPFYTGSRRDVADIVAVLP